MMLVLAGIVHAQNLTSSQLLSTQDIKGTARYVGLGGAMVALGGDPSAAQDNPAAIGVYRRTEVMLSTDVKGVTCKDSNNSKAKETSISIPQVSWNVYFPNGVMREKGIIGNSLMLSYHRLSDYRSRVGLYDESRTSTSNMVVVNSGRTENYSLMWGMNVSNRWYIGAGVGLTSVTAGVDQSLTIQTKADHLPYSSAHTTSISGLGVRLSAGIIYRPTTWMRIGAAFVSPSWESMSCSYYRADRQESYSVKQHMVQPLRANAGVAFVLGKKGLLSMEYDYAHPDKSMTQDVRQKYQLRDTHFAKCGLEIVAIKNLFVDLGYAYRAGGNWQLAGKELLNTTQFVSAALSFRNQFLIIGLAYQYSWGIEHFTSDVLDQIYIGTPYTRQQHLLTFSIAYHGAAR